MNWRNVRLWLLAGALALSPGVAYGNGGTALIWAFAFHLVLGNSLIGVAEGLLLSSVFEARTSLCVLSMIAANYVSTWLAAAFLIPRITASVEIDLYNAWRWLWCMVVITYFVTVVIEWPFVALCFCRKEGWLRKSILGSLLVQSVSYLMLFGWYWMASGKSLFTDLAVVEASAISLPTNATLYYLWEEDGGVYVRGLAQGEARKIYDGTSLRDEDRLILRESCQAAACWDLVLSPRISRDPRPPERVVAAGLACDVVERPSEGLGPGGDVPRFREDQSGWKFQFGYMAGSLHGENAKEGRSVTVSLETPFLIWGVWCPTQLPSGHVVFQLGRNQICVLDPNEQTIALVTKGCSPVVTMNNSSKYTGPLTGQGGKVASRPPLQWGIFQGDGRMPGG